jgi:hypothetical protein
MIGRVSMELPPIDSSPYNRSKSGFYGELGEGANAKIRFLQTAISREELDTITLIENIPGSERWDVRDLFQRDVDKERVTHAILPYLKDREKVKFFNPLTLILLPLDSETFSVEKELIHVAPEERSENGHEYTVFERPHYYEFKKHKSNPAYSELRWNDQKVRIVAIDGQHRLSALKRWKDEPGEGAIELGRWTIPVVVLGVFKADGGAASASLLEIVRNTFVYINTRAEAVNQARRILLDDESITAICVQEMVRAAHANDVLAPKDRDRTRMPLLVYDWRGDVKWREETGRGVRVSAPAALKTIEELHGWLLHYVLGEDGSEWQYEVLNIEDMVPPIESLREGTKLSFDEAERLRTRFHETLFPGLCHLLENFTPYKDYIAQCRAVEQSAVEEGDIAGHAFMKLRFGSARVSPDVYPLVQEKYDELQETFGALKGGLPELLSLDIGMRGVMCAFAETREHLQTEKKKGYSWLEYARWFTSALNDICAAGWFRSYDDLDKDKRKLLQHVAFDQSGAIVNYKFKDVEDGLGPLLVMLVAHAGDLESETQATVWEECSERLRKPLMRGFRRHHKGQLQDFSGTPADLRAEVTKRATRSVSKRLKELAEYLNIELA